LSRLNDNAAFGRTLHSLLGVGLQLAGFNGPLTLALDRIHHILFLCQEGVAQCRHPVQVFIHHGKDCRKDD